MVVEETRPLARSRDFHSILLAAINCYIQPTPLDPIFSFLSTPVEISPLRRRVLSRWHRQRRNSTRHGPEQPPRHFRLVCNREAGSF